MKIKKIVAGVAAAAMACTTMAAMSVSVSAINAGTVVDFEDGDSSFVYMNDLDGGSKATISVEDYNGSKQLKIDPESCTLYSKIWLDLDSMMDRAVATEIGKIEFDIALVPDTAEEAVAPWIGGEIGSAGGFDRTGKNIQASQADPNWTSKNLGDLKIEWDDLGNPAPGAAVTGKGSRTWLMKNEKFTLTGANPFVAIMINGGQATGNYSIYIDNIVFSDSKGNALTMGVTAPAETEAAPEETTAAPEETTAAPAETEAAPVEAADDDEVVAVADEEDVAPVPAETEAPAPVVTEAPAPAPVADTTTTPAATGNAAAASIAVVMAVAGVAAIAAKKRK